MQQDFYHQTLFSRFQLRYTREQKQEFLTYTAARMGEYNRAPALDHCRFLGINSINMVLGNPKNAKVILTANYDTPARRFFPHIKFLNSKVATAAFHFVILSLLALFSYLLISMLSLHFMLGICFFFILAVLFYRGVPNQHNINTSTPLIALYQLAVTNKLPICFVLTDNGDLGSLGLRGFLRKHRPTAQVVQILEIGNGTRLVLKGHKALLEPLVPVAKNAAFLPTRKKNRLTICRANKTALGYCINHIKTPADTWINEDRCADAINSLKEILEHVCQS